MEKKISRLRRAKRARMHIRELGVPRLTVHRSGQHLYAQVTTANGDKVIAAASTTQKYVRDGLKNTKNKSAAAAVGKAIAEKAKAAAAAARLGARTALGPTSSLTTSGATQ